MRGLASCLLLALALAPGAARAQCEPEPQPSPAIRAAARPHYRAGIEASRAERWMEARESFQRAAGIVPLAPIVYNLATAQSETGMIVEAAENYRTFLRRCVSQQTPELRAEAQQLLAAIAPRVGRLVIRVENFDAAVDGVTLDGTPISPALIGAEMPANPGSHELRVLRLQEELAARSVTIEEGRTSTVALSVPAYVPTRDRPVGGGGGDDTALIVGLIAGAVAVLGGAAAIVAVVLVEGQSSLELPPGTFGRAAQVNLLEF